MLNGVAPILIIDFEKSVNLLAPLSKIPVLKNITATIPIPSIPLYLDERVTGLYIDSQTKNIDVNTDIEDLKAANPIVTQKGINSIITINMVANSDSFGMILLSALCDEIFASLIKDKYTITYLNRGVTLFGGLLHSFSAVQNSENDLYNISLQLSKGKVTSTIQGLVSKIIQPFNGTIPGAAS